MLSKCLALSCEISGHRRSHFQGFIVFKFMRFWFHSNIFQTIHSRTLAHNQGYQLNRLLLEMLVSSGMWREEVGGCQPGHAFPPPTLFPPVAAPFSQGVLLADSLPGLFHVTKRWLWLQWLEQGWTPAAQGTAGWKPTREAECVCVGDSDYLFP